MILTDRAFFWQRFQAWKNEQLAHLMEHEGKGIGPLPTTAPAGPDCWICRHNEEMISHWQSRIGETA